MNDILITIMTSGVTTSIAFGVYRHFLTRSIENHKNNLLFDSQRKVHDFQLFSTKKHETYAELYSILHKATDSILNITNEHQLYSSSFKEYTEEEVDKYLEEKNIIQVTKDRIKTSFKTNKEKMNNEIHSLIAHENSLKADILRMEAYNTYSHSLIYQSFEVKRLCEEITDTQKKLIINFYVIKDVVESEETIKTNIKNFREKLKSLREKLHEEMQSELSVGYYSK